MRQVLAPSTSPLFSAFRRAARLHAWFAFLTGVALIVLVFVVPRYAGAKTTGRSFDYALMALLAAPPLVVVSLLYAVLSIFVRRHHLSAVVVLSVLTGGQGLIVGWCAFCFLAPNAMDAPLLGLACATYAAALWATGVLGTLVTIGRVKSAPGGAGFPVVPPAASQV